MMDAITMDEDNEEKIEKPLKNAATVGTFDDELTENPLNDSTADETVIDESTEKCDIDAKSDKSVNNERTEMPVNDLSTELIHNDENESTEQLISCIKIEETAIDVKREKFDNDELIEEFFNEEYIENCVIDKKMEKPDIDVKTDKIVNDKKAEKSVAVKSISEVNIEKVGSDALKENIANDGLIEEFLNEENSDQSAIDVKMENIVNDVDAEKSSSEKGFIHIKTEKNADDEITEQAGSDVLTEKILNDELDKENTGKSVVDVKMENIVNEEKSISEVNVDKIVIHVKTEKVTDDGMAEKAGSEILTEKIANHKLIEELSKDENTGKSVIDVKREKSFIDVKMETIITDEKVENPVNNANSADSISEENIQKFIIHAKTEKDKITEKPHLKSRFKKFLTKKNEEKPESSIMDEKKRKIFDRRLISQIRKFGIIYDNRHKFSSNADRLESAWQEIADKLRSDADTCKSRYTELCHKYQSYVGRLRNQFISNQKENCGQSFMNLDSELICLFKFIYNPKYCPLPHDMVQTVDEKVEEQQQQNPANEMKNPATVDDDVILIEQKPELIVIDEDDTTNNTAAAEEECKVTKEMKRLVEQVKEYPELYDTSREDYTDYARKSFVWNTIAVQIGDKGTKLIKRWILMVTRYEWEISKNLKKKAAVATYQTELQKLMEFFKPYILANPHTVFKYSFYLKKSWYNPIEYFKEIHTLIDAMKKTPQVVCITDELWNKPRKNNDFFQLWGDVAKTKGNTPGQCETTWLIMRLFYTELLKMREHNYQLTDKWYFETLVAELYELAKQTQLGQKKKKLQKQRKKLEDKTVNAKKRKVECVKPALVNVSGNTAAATIVATNSPSITHPPTQLERPPLPKITSAISLAPKIIPTAAVNGSLIIRPIGLPANVLLPPPPTPLQSTVTSSIPPLQLPFALPKQITVSAIAATNSPASPPIVISNARTMLYPAPCSTIKVPPSITITPKTTNTSKVPPKPLVYINVGTKSSTIIPINVGRTNKPSATATATSVSSVATPPVTPLPKIGGAISLFKSNEIKIEFVDSLQGKQLFVDHPPLREKYNLPMPTVEKFVREVLAIPLLHYQQHTQQNLINGYWEHISQKFKLPPHICRACWNFLEDKFSRIIHLKELLKPFSTTLIVWTESYDLFHRFNDHAVSNGWHDYISSLPEVIKCIGTYPVLYKDVSKDAKETTSEMQELHVMRSISSRFPSINHISTIWISLKNVFCQYMSDIELGIDNKWHMHWWRVLARLKFLVETRYKTNEPYYYIVSNKMMKEIKRCALVDAK